MRRLRHHPPWCQARLCSLQLRWVAAALSVKCHDTQANSTVLPLATMITLSYNTALRAQLPTWLISPKPSRKAPRTASMYSRSVRSNARMDALATWPTTAQKRLACWRQMLWEPLCLLVQFIYISNAVLVCCMLHFLDKVWCQVQVGVLGRLVACTTVLQRVSCVLHSHTSNRVLG